MQYYGITVGADHITLVILSNIDLAAREEWGSNFKPALQAIRQQYSYNYVNTDKTIATTLKGLAGADTVRKLKEALQHTTTESANAVSN